MPKSRTKKEEEVQLLAGSFSKSASAVFITQSGVSVRAIEELRRNLRDAGSELRSIKKTLLNRALEDQNIELDTSLFNGNLAVVFSYNDEVAAAQVVYRFSKTHEGIRVIGGLLEKRSIPIEMVISLAELPTKQELLARTVYVIGAPLTGFMNVLSGTIRGLITVLTEINRAKQHTS